MTPNELLLWLSARKAGSWPQFRGAVETLDLASNADDAGEGLSLPLHQRVRFNLERLGHVEFAAAGCDDGWRVVPPTLALSRSNERTIGVLCGARTLPLLEGIERAAGTLLLRRSASADCPDVLRFITPDAQALIELAHRQGLPYQLDTPAALLSHIPPVDSVSGRSRTQMPIAGKEWDVRRFVIDKKLMKWVPATLQEANAPGAQGLFRFTRFQTPQYFLCLGRETIGLPGAVGKYLVLQRSKRRVLRYTPRECRLSLPAIVRPPLLTERALILCSGFPPAVSDYRGRPILTYEEIPEEVAGMAAEVLGQGFV